MTAIATLRKSASGRMRESEKNLVDRDPLGAVGGIDGGFNENVAPIGLLGLGIEKFHDAIGMAYRRTPPGCSRSQRYRRIASPALRRARCRPSCRRSLNRIYRAAP